MKRLVLVLLAIFAAGSSATFAAEGNTAFSLKIRGLSVGIIYLTGRENDKSYAVSGVIESTGLARAIRHFAYRGSAKGSARNGVLRPQRYQETADTGRRSSEALIIYENGTPRVVRYSSPKQPGPDSPDPTTQTGTVDPLTAIYGLLRDVPRENACVLDMAMFDGKRRSRISMAKAGSGDGLPFCAGRYERLQGFTAEEVSRHRYFDFRLTYSDAGNGMLQVERVAFDSFYGTASIDRR